MVYTHKRECRIATVDLPVRIPHIQQRLGTFSRTRDSFPRTRPRPTLSVFLLSFTAQGRTVNGVLIGLERPDALGVRKAQECVRRQ